MMGAGMPSMEGMPSKDDLEKTPGSVIVPCRARGMPMDHNFKVRAWSQCVREHDGIQTFGLRCEF